VRANREIAAASLGTTQRRTPSGSHVQLRYPIAPHVDATEGLEPAGFGDSSLPAHAPVPVRLRIDSWPVNF